MMNKIILFRIHVGGIAAIIVIIIIIIIAIINIINNHRITKPENVLLTHPQWLKDCLNNPEWIKNNPKTYAKLQKKLNK